MFEGLSFEGGYVSGPSSRLLAVKAEDWHLRYERSMMASARTQDVEEYLDDVEASPRELV